LEKVLVNPILADRTNRSRSFSLTFNYPRDILQRKARIQKRKSVPESIQTWVKLNGCEGTPRTDALSKDGHEKKVTRTTYSGGKDFAEVVLVVIEGNA
jgi:hypothetical protein